MLSAQPGAVHYQYLADNDGEWGEIRFDFENGTAEIVRLAKWDTIFMCLLFGDAFKLQD